MRSDSGWEISAELAGITRQIIENIDLNSKGMPNASSFSLHFHAQNRQKRSQNRKKNERKDDTESRVKEVSKDISTK